jgi:hypothetical protein
MCVPIYILLLQDARERVFAPDAGVETVPLGLYIVRGDSMYVLTLPYLYADMAALRCLAASLANCPVMWFHACSSLIGEVDEATEQGIAWDGVKGHPVGPIHQGAMW